MHALIVEDDIATANYVKEVISEMGFVTTTAVDGEDGEWLAKSFTYDLIILDIVLPKRNGIEVCRSLRINQVATPIIMLSGLQNTSDKVTGLDAGADDYIGKPFCPDELLARIRTVLRCKVTSPSPILRAGDCTINTLTREVKCGKNPMDLSNKEYLILEYFMRHEKTVITRRVLEFHIWGFDFDNESNVVDVYISKLRRKLNQCKHCRIKTVSGAGYQLLTS